MSRLLFQSIFAPPPNLSHRTENNTKATKPPNFSPNDDHHDQTPIIAKSRLSPTETAQISAAFHSHCHPVTCYILDHTLPCHTKPCLQHGEALPDYSLHFTSLSSLSSNSSSPCPCPSTILCGPNHLHSPPIYLPT